MTPELWQRVRDVLYAALEREPGERGVYLDEACADAPEVRAEVESLLEAAATGAGSLLDVAEEMPAARESAGTVVGPYRLLEEVGRGGMGAVYVAVRDDGHFEHQVAIKLLQKGLDSEAWVRRFRYERQILAFLNHPNIAGLLDGGTTEDGRPYLVMEYVEGKPLLEYCREAGLGLRQRLELFVEVCGAVEYAHRNLIVHRDLKPGNILVTKLGVPKLLDFGIARILFPERAAQAAQTVGPRIFTAEYASPEQVRGGVVTTATDVYSLGAVLYEVLCGARAHRFASSAAWEIERVVCQQEPLRPSVAVEAGETPVKRGELEGDLDRIVLKALEKEPARRYLSVEQLSADLRRYLDGRPVLARDATLRYRAMKFVRRNRGQVAAGALVALSLVVGLGAALWQASVARAERNRAERRFEEGRRLANSFLIEHDMLASLPGGTELREKLIGHALEYLDSLAKESAGERSIQQDLAVAYEKLGDVQGRADRANVGDTAAALASYRKSMAIREGLLAGDPGNESLLRDLASSLARLSGALKVAGDYAAGLDCDRRALELRRRLLSRAPEDRERRRQVADSLTTLGGSLSQFGDWKGVLAARSEALAVFERLAAEGDANEKDYRGLTLAQSRMGSILAHEKDLTGAKRFAELAIGTARRAIERWPHDVPLKMDLASALGVLARVEGDAGQPEAALGHLQEARAIHAELAEADAKDFRVHSLLATSDFRLGRVNLKLGRLAEAKRWLEAAFEQRSRLAKEHPLNAGARGEQAEALGALGDLEAQAGRMAEARRLYEKAQGMLEHLQAEGRSNAASNEELGRLQGALGKLGR